ncbi:unnamed protein product [Auanema sp. JU1783]|nr:unnamed protein product [Auanema sp. JU1783]
MFRVVVFVSFVISAQAIIDTNCTDGTNPTNAAINCDDVYSTTACTKLYTTPLYTTPVALDTTEREFACFSSDDTTIDLEVRDIAIANCPKTCGYCCLSKEYNCRNAERPRITCSTITRAMCRDATWREIIAQDCPAACGFCLLGGCIDKAVDCATQPTMCFIDSFRSFVNTNCQRTCGLCTTSSTTGSSSTCTTIADTSPNCASWRNNGFCTNTFYTVAQRRQYCSRTCNIC